MERRKIMALGGSSRVISLPKTWVRRYNLDKGDMVSVYIQSDGSLAVHPSADVREDVRRISLDVGADESGNSIVRRIIGSYLDGYTIIKLMSERIFNVEQQKVIREIVGTLYMMIIESEASSIVLEALIDESRVSLSSGVERMHMITYSMCRDILKSMKSWDKELARSAASLEDDVDQMMYFLSRLIRSSAVSHSLSAQLGIDTLDCLDYQTLVHRIERIADYATSIAESVTALIESNISIPEKVMTTLIKAAEMAFQSYDMAVKSYLSRDVDPTNGIIDKQQEIEELYMGMTPLTYFGETHDTSHLSNIINIRENIMKLCHDIADIAELTIDRVYE